MDCNPTNQEFAVSTEGLFILTVVQPFAFGHSPLSRSNATVNRNSELEGNTRKTKGRIHATKCV
jgi:hypothetical protein